MVFLRIAWPWQPSGTEASTRTRFNQLLDLGINAFCSYHKIDDYRDRSSATDWYDMVYRLANEMGMKVIQYTGVHRLYYKGAKTGESFITRYSKFPACAGFMYGDEPALQGWDHDGCKWAVDEAHRQGADPNKQPMFPVWNYGIPYPKYAYTCRPNWCELYDVGCVNCYPYSLWGADPLGPPGGLHHWVNHSYRNAAGDGFGDCGKGMIPVIQADVEGSGAKHPFIMPDLIGQYNIWESFYGSAIKGIAFWHPRRSGDAVGFLESGSIGENLRSQIKEVSLLTGWSPPGPPPPTYPCPYCDATFSSQADLDGHIALEHHYVCSYCGTIFPSQADLDAHIASEHLYTCPHCGATFSSQEELDIHIAAEHPEEPPIGEVVPWYKKYAPHLAIAGAITALITYLSLKKRG